MESTKEARRVNFDLNKEELEYFRDELRLEALLKQSSWKIPNKVVNLENLDFKNQKVIIAVYNNCSRDLFVSFLRPCPISEITKKKRNYIKIQ